MMGFLSCLSGLDPGLSVLTVLMTVPFGVAAGRLHLAQFVHHWRFWGFSCGFSCTVVVRIGARRERILLDCGEMRSS